MAILTELIPQQNFELVRDRIGEIIKDELENQVVLQPNELALKDVSVFVDRIVKINKSELPLINVFLDIGNFNNQDVEAQDGVFMYTIQFYFGGKSSQNEARGDQASLRNLQRLIGVVRGIIQSAKYLTLGFAKPSVLHRSIKSILISDPAASQDGSNISQGSLTLEVRLVEDAEMFTSRTLLGADTTIKLSESSKGFEYKIDS